MFTGSVKPFLAPGPHGDKQGLPLASGLSVCPPLSGRHTINLPPLLSYRPMPGSYGVMGDDGAMDYSVHEAWNEATNVYLVVILVSFGLFMYAKR